MKLQNFLQIYLPLHYIEVDNQHTLWCQKRGMSGKRVMTHLVCVLDLKRVMAVQVYTLLAFFSAKIFTYFVSKIAD